jgi:hypothetical protein
MMLWKQGALRVQVGTLLMGIAATVACQEAPAVGDPPEGTSVTIQTEDGRRVSGQLMMVDQNTAGLTGDNNGRTAVEPSSRAETKSTDDATRSLASRVVRVPAGSGLDAILETALASNANQVDDPVRATLMSPLVVDGVTVAPRGSALWGSVIAVQRSGRIRGRAALTIRFDRLQGHVKTYGVAIAPLRFEAEASKGDDAAKVGIGAAAGAIIGGIAGGGKGAAVGSVVGAGAGTTVVLATSGEEVVLNTGRHLRLQLIEPIAITVPALGVSSVEVHTR